MGKRESVRGKGGKMRGPRRRVVRLLNKKPESKAGVRSHGSTAGDWAVAWTEVVASGFGTSEVNWR